MHVKSASHRGLTRFRDDELMDELSFRWGDRGDLGERALDGDRGGCRDRAGKVWQSRAARESMQARA